MGEWHFAREEVSYLSLLRRCATIWLSMSVRSPVQMHAGTLWENLSSPYQRATCCYLIAAPLLPPGVKDHFQLEVLQLVLLAANLATSLQTERVTTEHRRSGSPSLSL